MQFLIGWCIIFSLIGFCSMGIDKRKAQLGKWRIPERTPFSHRDSGRLPGVHCGHVLFSPQNTARVFPLRHATDLRSGADRGSLSIPPEIHGLNHA